MVRGTGKSGQQVAEENVQALIERLTSYEQSSKPLPRYGIELNQSQIAKECGFDRKVFRNNPRCADLLKQADEADRKRHMTLLQQAETKREEKAKVDEDRAALEAQNLKLMAENASLRREIERFRRLESIMAETGKLPG
ncbi:hypothetical protein [Dongia sp.]|jgi:uncharacterized protein (UPF0335 family)|uniref:hypothetical protein n=1 Tax=Dongia sp. TaxID=1977262 RepID=UPI0035B2A32C